MNYEMKEERNIKLDSLHLPDLVVENLYLGNMSEASDKENLKSLGITHILIFASYIEPAFPKDFVYKQIQVHDLPDYELKEHFEECNNFIKNGLKIGAVLIHCAAGFSRSATCVIAYLMKENKWEYEKSLEFLKSKRPSKYTNPNYGFKLQLKDYEQELMLLNC